MVDLPQIADLPASRVGTKTPGNANKITSSLHSGLHSTGMFRVKQKDFHLGLNSGTIARKLYEFWFPVRNVL